jgi:mycothiol synthase
VEEWVFLDRIVSHFKFNIRPIPILNPIFHYSSIPTFQKVSRNLLLDWVMKTCLVPAHPDWEIYNNMNKHTFTIRNYHHSDFNNYAGFRMEVEKREPSAELVTQQHIAEDLEVPKFFPEKDLFVAETAGSLIGYLSVFCEAEINRALLDCLVHPQHRRKGIATHLFERAIQHVKQSGISVAQVSIKETNTAAGQLASRLKLAVVRRFLQLNLDICNTDLPEVNPGEFEIRALQRGEEDELTGLQHRCFAGTWGFNPNTIEDILYRLNLSGCAVEDVIMAYEDNSPVGYCWTRIIPLTNPDREKNRGLIHMIGVDPEFRHKGIGKKVLLAGLKYLKHIGSGTVGLTVDHENLAARSLYISIGFKESATLEWFEKKLI